jgi:hypothetical protein
MSYLYENQKVFCEQNKLPLFANRSCSHDVSWGGDYHDKPTEFDDMLRDRYGEQAEIISMSQHIISCPVCWKSWCD